MGKREERPRDRSREKEREREQAEETQEQRERCSGNGGRVGSSRASGRGGISHSRQRLPVKGHLSLPHAGAWAG